MNHVSLIMATARTRRRFLAAVLSWLCLLGSCSESYDPMGPEGGYYRREYSLVQPYQGEEAEGGWVETLVPATW